MNSKADFLMGGVGWGGERGESSTTKIKKETIEIN